MPHASHLCSICKQQCCLREPSVKEHECRAVQSAIYQLGCEIVRLQRQAWRVDAATCAACKSIDDCSNLHLRMWACELHSELFLLAHICAVHIC
jgi:hypothetical protein